MNVGLFSYLLFTMFIGAGDTWAQGLKADDFQLLCPDGTRSPVSDYKRCNLARVPSRGIVVHSSIDSTVIYNMLKEGLVRTFILFYLLNLIGQKM